MATHFEKHSVRLKSKCVDYMNGGRALPEIYFDNAATTRTLPEACDVAVRLMLESYGNPSSLHNKGLKAQLAVDEARERLSGLMGCVPEEIIFTSGGTESNNLAILGGAAARKRRGDNIVVAAFEHSSVLGPVKHLEENGFTVRRITPRTDGNMDIKAFAEAVDDKTVLASCMFANSETGAVTPINELAGAIRRRNKETLIHCDAVQALGKLKFSAAGLGVDLISVSGHKLHAPKGCGALYIRKGTRILPITYGGPQEKGLRPGTENAPLIAAFGRAALESVKRFDKDLAAVTKLCEYFVNKTQDIEGICINSPPEATPYIMNISIPGYRSETLLHYLGSRKIYVSSGSACSGGAKSHVLASMGLSAARIDSALRISFCRENTLHEIDSFFEALTSAMNEIARV